MCREGAKHLSEEAGLHLVGSVPIPLLANVGGSACARGMGMGRPKSGKTRMVLVEGLEGLSLF